MSPVLSATAVKYCHYKQIQYKYCRGVMPGCLRIEKLKYMPKKYLKIKKKYRSLNTRWWHLSPSSFKVYINQFFWNVLISKTFEDWVKISKKIFGTHNFFCKLFNYVGLHHPLDGVTNPEYKLLHFLNNFFLQIEEGTSF
jgi:hypothetical protein